MSYTLCVIDMQEVFSAARKGSVQKSCIREVKKAIRDKAPIVFVEYAGYDPTLPILTNVVKQANYKKAYHVSKNKNDGGTEVSQFLTKKHLPKLNMRVCGVNTDYCVRETVEGLRRNIAGAQIHIVGDACSSAYNQGHISGLNAMKNLDNVKLIRTKGLV